MSLSQNFVLLAKNVLGWRQRRKVVTFVVDDYGNIRLNSRQARNYLDSKGLKVWNRFDAFDSLENSDDLESLFDVLCSVSDSVGKNAVFTPFSLPANINFDEIEDNKYESFCYELLPDTLSKYRPNENVFGLIKQGISQGIFCPEFHGREHLNVKMLMHLLRRRDSDVLACFNVRSYTSIGTKPFGNIRYPAAFAFEQFSENEALGRIIEDGLNCFERVFGYRSIHFTSPTMNEHSVLHNVLYNNGINFVDAPTFKLEHQGNGNYSKSFHYTGKGTKQAGQYFVVRNCVFEPTSDDGIDWVKYCLKQIEYSFMMNKPANISSHRINFCGNISESNRKKGLASLSSLLKAIVLKWPDVEFMSSRDMLRSFSNLSD